MSRPNYCSSRTMNNEQVPAELLKKLLSYLEKVSCIRSCSIRRLLSFFSGGKSLNELTISVVPLFQHKNINQTHWCSLLKSNTKLSIVLHFDFVTYNLFIWIACWIKNRSSINIFYWSVYPHSTSEPSNHQL